MSFDRIEHAGAAVPTTLAGDITSASVTASLVAVTGWPSGTVGPFYAVIDQGLPNEEKVQAISRVGNTLAGLVRGVDGTAASTHSAGAAVAHCFTAVEADEANDLANMTAGSITNPGDSLWGSGPGTLTRVPAGANGTVPQFDGSQSTGVKMDFIGPSSLAASVVGSGLAGAAGTPISVNVDNATTTLDANGRVSVRLGGISTGYLATGIRPQFIVADATALAALTGLVEGDQAWVQDTNVRCTYNGTAWEITGGKTTYQVVVTGGPTSGATALVLGAITIPAMPATYQVEACTSWAGSNSVAGDEFLLRITVDGVVKGGLPNQHQGSINVRVGYSVPTSTLTTIAANAACTVRTQIVRLGGTGVITEEQAGLMTARLVFA